MDSLSTNNDKLVEGTKHDSNKPRLDLISGAFTIGVAQVLTRGAVKYEAWNWAKGITYSRVIGAALRHMQAYADGEDNDPEWGLSHLFHAGCCLMFLAHYDSKPYLYKRFDDRPDFDLLVNGTRRDIDSERVPSSDGKDGDLQRD